MMQTFHAASEADNSNSRSFFFSFCRYCWSLSEKKYKKFKILLLKGCRSAERSQLSKKNWRKMPGRKNRACVRVYNILQLSRPFRFSALRSFINICIKCTLCHYLDVPFHLVLCISTWINIFSIGAAVQRNISFDVPQIYCLKRWLCIFSLMHINDCFSVWTTNENNCIIVYPFLMLLQKSIIHIFGIFRSSTCSQCGR